MDSRCWVPCSRISADSGCFFISRARNNTCRNTDIASPELRWKGWNRFWRGKKKNKPKPPLPKRGTWKGGLGGHGHTGSSGSLGSHSSVALTTEKPGASPFKSLPSYQEENIIIVITVPLELTSYWRIRNRKKLQDTEFYWGFWCI